MKCAQIDVLIVYAYCVFDMRREMTLLVLVEGLQLTRLQYFTSVIVCLVRISIIFNKDAPNLSITLQGS